MLNAARCGDRPRELWLESERDAPDWVGELDQSGALYAAEGAAIYVFRTEVKSAGRLHLYLEPYLESEVANLGNVID